MPEAEQPGCGVVLRLAVVLRPAAAAVLRPLRALHQGAQRLVVHRRRGRDEVLQLDSLDVVKPHEEVQVDCPTTVVEPCGSLLQVDPSFPLPVLEFEAREEVDHGLLARAVLAAEEVAHPWFLLRVAGRLPVRPGHQAPHGLGEDMSGGASLDIATAARIPVVLDVSICCRCIKLLHYCFRFVDVF